MADIRALYYSDGLLDSENLGRESRLGPWCTSPDLSGLILTPE